jgi:hypothetical protein
MDNKTYSAWRDGFLAEQMPYRAVQPQELISTGENTYILNGLELTVKPGICSQIDTFMGVTHHQSKSVTDTFGSDGIRDFRNYLALSNNNERYGKLALIADPEKREIVKVLPLKREAIPAESFFDFLEMFMNDNRYMPQQFYLTPNRQGEVIVNLIPDTPEFVDIAKEEEFMTNGIWMRWNLGEVEIGNYYIRMVCTNGTMQKVQQSFAHTYELDDKSIATMLGAPQRGLFIGHNLNKLRESAHIAMKTDASLAEVRNAKNLLTYCGIEDKDAESIAPYNDISGKYALRGYSTNYKLISQYRSGINMWDLYNSLTHFATHNTIWAEDDNRRTDVMFSSAQLLFRKRDIQQYISIFE